MPLVVDTQNVVVGQQCPIVFRGSIDECVAWIGAHGDTRKRHMGYYQIDYDDEEVAKSKPGT